MTPGELAARVAFVGVVAVAYAAVWVTALVASSWLGGGA